MDFGDTEAFAPLREFTASLLQKRDLLNSPDPTLANGWHVGDSFGSPVRVKKVPFQTIFGRVVASSPESVTFFGVKRTFYAIEFVADQASYGIENENLRWIGIFVSRNIVVMYNPITGAVKRAMVFPASLYLYRAEQFGNRALSRFLARNFRLRPRAPSTNESSPTLPVMKTGLGIVRRQRGPM